MRAALTIATSGWWAEVSFDSEPMEWRVIAGPYWNAAQSVWTDFRLRVLTFPEPSGYPEADGHKLFEAECLAEDFVHAVLKAAEAVWDEYGTDGYDRRWGGQRGFPLRALTALKAAMSVQEPRSNWQRQLPSGF